MSITDPFILRPGVLLTPCAELSEDVASRLAFEKGDYTLSHRRGRALAQVIDGDTAALLQLFRQPRTIVEAVVESSRILGRDPRAWLDELLPHFAAFVERRVLVHPGSDDDKDVEPHYEHGAVIGGWTLFRCVSLTEDSEIHEGRWEGERAAVKIARVDGMRAMLENETAILRHLGRLISSGLHEDRLYVISEWIDGVDAKVAAARRRDDRTLLIELCASIAAAYAALHERDVLHADVHPGNVLAGDGVSLVDFGCSRFLDQPAAVVRGGLFAFFEPEYWAELRRGNQRASSPAGEQYAVAALLYLLVTGEHYLRFNFDREEMIRQIETEPPLPFAARGIPPWPEVEAILARALDKDPAQRHGSMAEMAARLAEVRDAALRESLAAPVSAEAHALVEQTIASFARGGEMFADGYTKAPVASINYGCAGAAVGLLRMAIVRSDAALLALADVWRSRAAALIDHESAFYSSEHGLSRNSLGDVTPFHTEAGVHAAEALIAGAFGDQLTVRRAISAFIRASERPCAQLDLTLGRSGSLLAAAILLELGDDARLRAFGAETMRAIWQELDPHPPIAESRHGTYLGIAHGWAGYLYAALRWCKASGDALPPRLAERLEQYAALKIVSGRGMRWPFTIGRDSENDRTAGWCNGTAGHVFLCTLAHRLFGDDRWLELAEGAALDTWSEPRHATTLCCGTAGRAYALLNLYKHTGAGEWLARARQLANHAAGTATESTAAYPNALWKGKLGVAVLVADLASPENARMPFFE